MQPYTKLYAQLYDRLFPATQDEIDFYRHFLSLSDKSDARALECACGTGNLLLSCQREGFLVDGLDCSQEMLDICAQKAVQNKKTVDLYFRPMQDFNLERHYDTIYIPACSFMLLLDYAHAQRALKNFYDHLVPGGQLLISLFVPFNEISHYNPAMRLWKDVTIDDPEIKTRILVYESLSYRPLEQLRVGLYRFETYCDNQLQTSELHELAWRWYGAHEFKLMLESAGFEVIALYGDHTLQDACDHDETVIFRAVKK